MKNLIFVCAGGFFSELFEYITSDLSNNALKDTRIKGFIDDTEGIEHDQIEHLGKISDYEPRGDDYFLITLGSPVARHKLYRILKSKNAKFFTYVHSSAWVSSSASLGEGAVVCPFAIINAHATVGSNVAINVHASVGHDASVGGSSVLSPYSALNGNSRIGEISFMGSRSTIFPDVNVGDKCIVDTHSYVKKDVEDKSIVSLRSEYRVVKNRLI